jgi:hypothetical protein
MKWQYKKEENMQIYQKKLEYTTTDIRVNTHQLHEATPLSITKVPEGQPKLKVFQPLLGGAVGRSPPRLDG